MSVGSRGFLVLAFALAGTVRAAPPAATSLFPAGAGRGQTVEVKAAGTFDRWPVRVWTQEPGVEFEPGTEKGSFTVRVAADAPPGLRWVRFYDGEGATAPLPFEIDTLPSVAERETNDAPGEAQAVEPLPAVIDGRLGKRGDVDAFSIRLTSGQTLVASLKGQRIGSPMDAVLQIASEEGVVLGQAEDDLGLDPQLVFGAPADGTYLVRCFAFPSEPDSTIGFAGGDRFLYRLTLTAGPFLDHTLPSAVSEAEEAATVEAVGWNLPEELRRLPVAPTAGPGRVRIWHPSIAHCLELPVVPMPSDAERPSGGAARELTPPVGISGRIGEPGERDEYPFTARKGETWRLRAVARPLGSLLDAVLRVSDSEGRVLSEQDDADRGDRDAATDFPVPEDGEYKVAVTDLTGRGGLRYFYRLEVARPTPDFAVALAEDRITVTPGKPATLAVTVTRTDGFARPVEVSVLGLPGGVESPAVRDEGPSGDGKEKPKRSASAAVQLVLNPAEGGLAAFSGPVTVVGRAEAEGKVLERAASLVSPVPGVAIEGAWLTVIPVAE